MSGHQNCQMSENEPAIRLCSRFRWLWFGIGIICTVIGIAGIILPGLPGTPFLLIATWAFSKSSERFYLWLFNHPRFGQPVRNWHKYRAIPPYGKIAAVSMMSLSFVLTLTMTSASNIALAGMGGTMLCVAAWIVTRPSGPGDQARDDIGN